MPLRFLNVKIEKRAGGVASSACDAQSVKKALGCLMGPAFLKTAVAGVWYGSRRPGADIDIMVVQESEAASIGTLCGNLDLFVLGRARFEALVKLRDPMVTEPILTGELVFGDRRVWAGLRGDLEHSAPSADCVSHCCRRALEEALSAHNFCCTAEASGTLTHARWALDNLSYAISYLSFARHYAGQGAKACTLQQLIRERGALFPEFWDFWRSGRREKLTDVGLVRGWLENWFRFIASPGLPRASGLGAGA